MWKGKDICLPPEETCITSFVVTHGDLRLRLLLFFERLASSLPQMLKSRHPKVFTTRASSQRSAAEGFRRRCHLCAPTRVPLQQQ